MSITLRIDFNFNNEKHVLSPLPNDITWINTGNGFL